MEEHFRKKISDVQCWGKHSPRGRVSIGLGLGHLAVFEKDIL
jgi:hypothetical protein